jgi:dynein heavy chain
MLEEKDKIEELSKRADKCWNMEKKLNEIQDKIKELKCEVVSFKGTFIFKQVDETQQILDEQLNIMMMLKASPYIKGILTRTI